MCFVNEYCFLYLLRRDGDTHGDVTKALYRASQVTTPLDVKLS